MHPEREQLIRTLFDNYIEMYASRDPRLTEEFSDNFTGYTGGGDFLVRDRDEWVKITRQDFAQVPGHIRIEIVDLQPQDISDDTVAVTAFFHIHLPIPDHFLSREMARLVLVFRLEASGWKIAHSSISIPYPSVGPGEVYPLRNLHERNRELESLVAERTRELEFANQKLEIQTHTDWLTGISNRREFDQKLELEWRRSGRTGLPLALIMLDVDQFKHFNDVYGHVSGDSCLQGIARSLLRTARRAGEVVARYGGEEFVVLLPNTTTAQAMDTAVQIQREVWWLALPHVDTIPGMVTVSLGVASALFSSNVGCEDLVVRADAALYDAKRSGRNCVMAARESEIADGADGSDI